MNNVWNTINNIANKLHPIGSVYISQNPTDPSEVSNAGCMTSVGGAHTHFLTGSGYTEDSSDDYYTDLPTYGYYSGAGGTGVWGPLSNSGGLGQMGGLRVTLHT